MKSCPATGNGAPSPPTEASRKFLEEFRDQVERAGSPEAPALIEKIEQALVLADDADEAALAGESRHEKTAAYLAAVVQNSDDAIITKTLDGIITTWNPSAERTFGYTATEAIGQPITMLIPADRLDEESRIIERLRRGERVEHFETRRVRKDGSELDISLTISPVRDSAGRIVGASKIARDITQRKRDEEALRQSEEKYRAIFDGAAVSIWEEDFSAVKAAIDDLRAQGVRDFATYFRQHPEFVQKAMGLIRVLDVNDITVEMFEARDKAELLGSLPKIFGPESLAVFAAELLAIAQGRTFMQAEASLNTLRGNPIWVLFTMTVASTSQFDRVLFSVLDISQRKQAEMARDLALNEAERASNAKDKFLAMLSHELRTPLTPVLLTVSMIEGDPELPARLREDIVMIRQSVEAERRLVDDLLDISRFASGKISLTRAPVDFAAIVRQVADAHGPIVARKGVVLRCLLSDDLPKVNGDGVRLQQIVRNLLNNATKFTPKGGEIHITARREEDRVVMEVQDSGAGIEPARLRSIFEAFEQGPEDSARRLGGLGLGLAICKGLVEMHGGSIRAHSDGPGKGASFTVELPGITATPAATPTATPAAGESRPPKPLALGSAGSKSRQAQAS